MSSASASFTTAVADRYCVTHQLGTGDIIAMASVCGLKT